MADEFAKGFAIFSGSAMLWMILAGWYRTSTFEGPQFTEPVPEDPSTYEALGIMLMDGLFWFMILGPITFWLLIPAYKEARAVYAARKAE